MRKLVGLVVLVLVGSLQSSSVAAAPPGTAGPPPVVTCRTDPVAPAFSVELCVTLPAPEDRGGQRLRVASSVRITGAAPPVNGIGFRLDGTYLLFDPQQPYTFLLHPYRYGAGAHTLTASVAFSGGSASPPLDVPLELPTPAPAPPPPAPFRPNPGSDPAPGQPFVVAAVGDGASGLSAEGEVVDLIASWHPSLFLYLGDVYAQGAPEEYLNWYGEDGALFSRFRSITDPTLGNHEFESDRAGTPWAEYWGDPPPYYSVDTHGWHVVVLDDAGPATSLSTEGPEYRWLAADLDAHPDPCTLVTYHRPRFTEGGRGETATDMDAFWRLLAGHHVPIVLNGHSHNYQRWSELDADGAPVGSGGTTQFVVGTGGQWTSPLQVEDPRVAADLQSSKAWGALRLELTATGAHYRYITVTGGTKDAGTVPCAGS